MKKEISIPKGFEATIEGNKIILTRIENEDERIRKSLLRWLQSNSYTSIAGIQINDVIAWLEKQGQEPRRDSIWKHWKNGIAGNGEGEPIYLTKAGNTYNLSSCLCFECDYIELSELDNLMLEKQGEQKLPIEKLPEEMKTIGESLGFTTQEECDEYNKMVSDLIMSDDKDKPKFKVGDWIVFNGLTLYVKEVVKGFYRTISKGGIPNSYDWGIDNVARLWTIRDAKDGDVLVHNSFMFDDFIFIYNNTSILQAYCYYSNERNRFIVEDRGHHCPWNMQEVTPATKEQCDLLFQKMKEKGYEWDENNKILKEIVEDEEEPQNYKNQVMSEITDLVKHYIKQKPAWSEAGEDMKEALRTEYEKGRADAFAHMQKEWSEEDVYNSKLILATISHDQDLSLETKNKLSSWLKFIKERRAWKPSDAQMATLDYYANIYVDKPHGEVLSKLIKDLKNLKGE